MSAQSRWPLAIIAALALTVAANLLVLRLAGDDSAVAVEPDYYAKAVAWDSTQAARRASDALGWSADVALEPAGGREADVRVHLRDRDGAPIEGALVRFEAIHNRLVTHPVRAELTEDAAAGMYRARVVLAKYGMWQFRIAARRGEDRFELDVRRDFTGVP